MVAFSIHLNVPHGLLPEVCAAEADLEEHDGGGDVLQVELRVEQLLPQLRPPPRLPLGRAQQGQLLGDLGGAALAEKEIPQPQAVRVDAQRRAEGPANRLSYCDVLLLSHN